MPGHIRLGAPGDLRDYAIANMNQYSKTPANQFAAKLSTGAGSYDDLQNWSYFVMDDWRAGVGKTDPEAGGFLYAEAESRYPNRLTIPNAMSLTVAEDPAYPLNYGWQAGRDLYPNGALQVPSTTGSTGFSRISKRVRAPHDSSYLYFFVLLNSADTDQISVIVHADSAGLPGAELGSAAIITPSGEIGQHMYQVQLAGSGSFTAGTYYHVSLRPTNSGNAFALPFAEQTNTDGFSVYFNVFSVWTAITTGGFCHAVYFPESTSNSALRVVLFPATGNLYSASGPTLYRKTGDDAQWEIVEDYPQNITDLVVVGDELWVAFGDVANYAYVDSSDVSHTGTIEADLFLMAAGRVWATLGPDAYYTNDGVDWVGPIAVARPGQTINGLSFLEDFIYCATDDGLYYIGFGDFVYPVSKWGYLSPTNGKGMINHQGSLWIPLDQSLYRYDGSQMLPVGLDLGEGLPQNRVGIVQGLCGMNNWLVAAVSGINNDQQRSTLWAYNDQGWHFLAATPWGITLSGAMIYERLTRRLYVGGEDSSVWQLPIADSANFNNVTAYPMPKAPFAWMETDWFTGGLLEVFKDCESIYITGEGIDDNGQHVIVYWKDDGSSGWELLGTVTSNRADLRWSDYTTRPNTRQLKIGLALYTQSDNAPVVRAVRLKYHPMVSDWYRWNFPVLVADYQELPGMDRSVYSRAEGEAHLQSLITSVPPFILEDIDGTQYEVKVTGAPIQILDYEYLQSGPKYNALYNLALEQIRPASYGN